MDLLPDFLENPMVVWEDITKIRVDLFKTPFEKSLVFLPGYQDKKAPPPIPA
jgi:hypothetical protein